MSNMALATPLDAPAPRLKLRLAALRGWLLLAPAAVLLGCFFLYPVVRLMALSLLDGSGQPSLVHYGRLFGSPVYVSVLGTTLQIAFWTAIVALLAGYPVAYAIARAEPRSRARLMLWVLLPFWTSFLVRTFAWIVLLGRTGVLNDTLQRLGIVGGPLELIYNLAGVLVGTVHALMPLAILTLVPVLEKINRDLEKAASTLGARSGSTFWRISFPLSLPGVAAAGLLVFISALGFFITPALLGSPKQTMVGQLIIEQIQEMMNWGFGGAISALLITATILIFFAYDRLVGLSTLAGGSSEGDAAPSRAARLGTSMLGAAGRASDAFGGALGRVGFARAPSLAGRATVLLTLGFLASPALFLIPVSVSKSAFIEWPPALFSGQWYAALADSPQWLGAAARSITVATLSALLAVAIGTPAAFALTRFNLAGKSTILALLLAPLIVPRIVTAVGLFYLFAQIGLIGTTLGLVLGHAVLSVPYVTTTVMAVLKHHDWRLEQAASTLGAGRITTLRRVTLPLIRNGLIAAYLFAFVTSFDELTIALFVTGGLFGTLPKQMWDDALLKVSPMLAAVSVVLLVLITVFVVVAERLSRPRSA
ncbi:ABC transporter permease subunit [Methylobacterium nodulans]|uniref:Binding-protein-dependent transport systems inner membrane component n=1 Tax=Methylobacterium nodulans (strain LMG 21967 / CNCM I-2342 / ORS 2060) TaxID=460265 RepID=B8IA75_METNO|nr:ABC transporter permease subunit [Methylobacterium nodulans]ACL59138.1 binding-protein-dependent transport systems inner membrane component [Methylobacterium nodulans ORS 2060]